MTVSSFKFAVGSMLTVGALAASSVASAGIVLPTQGLKANATLTFSAEGFNNAKAATVLIAPLGNTIKLADATTSTGGKVPVFQFPITKADVSIGWDLKITPNSGLSTRSALHFTSDFGAAVLANFAVDFKAKKLFADIIDPYTKTSKNIVLYTFDESIPTKISLKNLVLNQTSQVNNLVFSQVAIDDLAYLLGLDDVLKPAFAILKWGTIDIQVTSYARKPAVSTVPFSPADAPAP